MNSIKNYAATQKAGRVASPQNVRTPGRSDEVKNNAGGFVFKVSDRDRLERFLILGTDGATYYVSSKVQVDQSIDMLKRLIASDEAMVLATIKDVSTGGRALKNTPAIFALAAVLTFGTNKAAARAAVNDVVRTGTHLFEFTEYLKALGGMGRAKRSALAGWYEAKTPEQLAYQAVKYRQRDGWTHRDVFRIAHPVGVEKSVGNFILGKDSFGAEDERLIGAFRLMQKAGSVKEVIAVLNEYKNLPWETIPTQFLTDAKVWKTLFYNNQLNGQALVRNITRLSRNGAFKDLSFAADYAARLVDEEMIAKTRLHPINYLNASVVHTDGQRGRSTGWGYASRTKDWQTSSVISDALQEGFHLAFKAVEPAGKRTMLAIDVSGSMSSPAMGLDLSCAQVSAAVAMTVARTEPAHEIRGFTSGGGYYGGSAELKDLGITSKSNFSDAMRKVQARNFGGTDCAQPMLWAKENGVEIDTFVVITDNETWAGRVKPTQALKQYRDAMGIDARLAVMAVAGSDFTIADPTDGRSMDFVGFDSNAPKVLADFSAGRI